MKSAAPGPAVLKAVTFIKNHLGKGTWSKGENLPSTIRLAKSAGVSPVSLTKAIAILKQEGLVNGVERGRIRAGRDTATEPNESLHHEAIWRMTRNALEKDIATGVYADHDALPSLKELQVRYGSCFRTMRKILRTMVADEILLLRGKTYLVKNARARSSNSRIVFVTYHIQAIPRSAINQGQYQVLSLFENESLRRGLKPEIVEIDFYNAAETAKAIAGPAINHSALGCVLDIPWWSGEVFCRSTISLLERLSLLKRPVAILDECGVFELPVQFRGNPMIQVFRIEGQKAGGRVGRMLRELGHRDVAYISPQHSELHSVQRLAGLKEQLCTATWRGTVTPFVASASTNHMVQLLDISGFDESLIRKIIAVDRTESQARDLYNDMLAYRKNRPRNTLTPEELHILRENLAGVRDMARRKLVDEKIFNKVCIDAFAAAGVRLSQIVLTPLFQQALAAKNATAWICVSDQVALAAIDFLHDHDIPVPGRISVIGFDNEPVKSFNRRLTTFDFNVMGFVFGMLNFITRPPRFSPSYQHSPIEIEGIIIQRETTAQVAESKS